jgi:HAD superfamily hydrolase (TIGR01490 family)
MNHEFPKLALVDMDGTLLSVSSEKLFLGHLVRSRLIPPGRLLSFGLGYVIHPFRTMIQGKGWNRDYLSGMQEEAIKREALSFSERELCSRIRPGVADIVGNLSGGGCRIVLISASLIYLVEPVARFVNADSISASVPSVEDDLFTGRLTGTRPWGRDKAAVGQRICEHEGIDTADCIALGDSWSDRHLMLMCGMAIAVHPEPGLHRLALRKGWKIVEGRHTRWA